MQINELKQIIANNDMDVAIVRKDYPNIDSYLRDMGYFLTRVEIIKAVDELAGDPYYTMIAKDIK